MEHADNSREIQTETVKNLLRILLQILVNSRSNIQGFRLYRVFRIDTAKSN